MGAFERGLTLADKTVRTRPTFGRCALVEDVKTDELLINWFLLQCCDAKMPSLDGLPLPRCFACWLHLGNVTEVICNLRDDLTLVCQSVSYFKVLEKLGLRNNFCLSTNSFFIAVA